MMFCASAFFLFFLFLVWMLSTPTPEDIVDDVGDADEVGTLTVAEPLLFLYLHAIAGKNNQMVITRPS